MDAEPNSTRQFTKLVFDVGALREELALLVAGGKTGHCQTNEQPHDEEHKEHLQ
jgi:hypothetical protein